MGILQFNGTSNYLKWDTLSEDLRNLPTAEWTLLFGVRHITNLNGWQGYGYLLSGTGNGLSQVGLSKSTNGGHDLYCDREAPAGSGFSWASLDPALNQDTLYVASKAAGSATANASKKVGSAGAWTHAAATSTGGNGLAADQLQIGAWQLSTIDLMKGYIAIVAMWNVELSQAQRAACGANWRTSDIWNAHPTPPLLLMECNVAKASLVNLGTASISGQSSNGVTVSTQTFGSWNFDGIGTPAVDQTSFIPLL